MQKQTLERGWQEMARKCNDFLPFITATRLTPLFDLFCCNKSY